VRLPNDLTPPPPTEFRDVFSGQRRVIETLRRLKINGALAHNGGHTIRLIAFAAPKVFDITIVWLGFELDAAYDQIAHAKTLGAREHSVNDSVAGP
jgi:hypothetical protein